MFGGAKPPILSRSPRTQKTVSGGGVLGERAAIPLQRGQPPLSTSAKGSWGALKGFLVF